MLTEKLKNYNLILASGSPRRQELLKELTADFRIEKKSVNESFPADLQASEISDYLCLVKAAAFQNLNPEDLVITSDTIVWFKGKALGKPKNYQEGFAMLRDLSGQKHEVISSVCFKTHTFKKVIHDTTEVWFKKLSREEIDFYLNTYQPFDKAGSYGIQEWIGFIGVEKLIGSYFNVMGFPTHLVYKTLLEIL